MGNPGRGMIFVLLLLASVVSTTQVLTVEAFHDKVQSVTDASTILRR